MRGTERQMTLTRRETCQSCRGAGRVEDRRGAVPAVSGHAASSARAAAAWSSRRAVTHAAGRAGWSRPPADDVPVWASRCAPRRSSSAFQLASPTVRASGCRKKATWASGAAGGRSVHHGTGGAARDVSARGRRLSHHRRRSACTKRRWAQRSTCRRPTAPRGFVCRRARRPGQRFHIRGRGAPSPRTGERGDLVVEVRIVLPRVLDERSKELLREFGKINEMERTGKVEGRE